MSQAVHLTRADAMVRTTGAVGVTMLAVTSLATARPWLPLSSASGKVCPALAE